MVIAGFATMLASQTPVTASQAMVVSPEPLATSIGVEIMRQGGNAFDAAAAVGFALAVTFPEAGNLGGGGFAVGFTTKGEKFALDFREKAPAKATADLYQDEQGNVIDGLSTDTYLSVGVPGSVDGLLALQSKYGKLKRSQIVEPAERLAKDGIEVRQYLHEGLSDDSAMLLRFPATEKVFFRNGIPIAAGDLLFQSDLGKTLEAIRIKGREGFYSGRVADLIVVDMIRNKGLITRRDLTDYRSVWRRPIEVSADGLKCITMPLPSSGGITLGQTFGLVDWDKLKSAGQNSVEGIHHLTEALRLAYTDRNSYLGDPDFVSVPVEKLLSPAYLAKRRTLMPSGKAGKSENIKAGDTESMQTTHYCVVDADGNVCAVTTTLNAGFGMGAVVPGAGFILNNEMDDFTSKPGSPNRYGLVQGDANAIAPGKRMLSSMTPSIFLKDYKFWMTVGSPGGPTIITTVLQTFLNCHVWNMNIREAIDAPRFHHQHFPDEIAMERAFDAAIPDGLKQMGYTITTKSPWGQAYGIKREADGSLTGWADSRGDGLAAGY